MLVFSFDILYRLRIIYFSFFMMVGMEEKKRKTTRVRARRNIMYCMQHAAKSHGGGTCIVMRTTYCTVYTVPHRSNFYWHIVDCLPGSGW